MNLVELKWEIDRLDNKLEYTIDHVIKMENRIDKLFEMLDDLKYRTSYFVPQKEKK